MGITISPWMMAFLMLMTGFAGFVDSAAGGGGLISLPAYLFAGLPPHYTYATNKFSAACGTTFATASFFKSGAMNVKVGVLAAIGSFAGSALGAHKLYNYEKEYLLFQTVYEQVKFVREKEIWDKAPYCVHERGIHLIDHLMMLPQSSLIDDVINDVLARMQEFDNVSWPQLDVMHIFKRRMMYCHLKVYRCIYRLVRTFFKSKRYKFQTL